MTAQLDLPGFRRNLDPDLELARIAKAKTQLGIDLSRMIEQAGESFSLGRLALHRAEAYAEDLFSDLFFDRERELEEEIEDDIAREDWPWRSPRR
jgi:hypothetical protein